MNEGNLLRRIGLIGAVMAIINISIDIYWKSEFHSHIEFIGILLVLWIGAISIGVYALSDFNKIRHVENISVGLLILAAISWSFATIYIQSPVKLGSDVPLFTTYSAMSVLNGVNPYTISLGSAHELLQHNAYISTPKLDGSHVTSLSYPAFSFLAYVPFVWAGIDVRVLGGVILFPTVVGIIYAYSPRELGLVPVLPLFISLAYLNAVVVDIEMLWVLPLMGAVIFWRDNLTASAICFGIACSAKQNPWFIAPFIVIRLILDYTSIPESAGFLSDGSSELFNVSQVREGVIEAVRYGSVSILVFLIPNLVFILDSPASWIQGVLTPVAGKGAPLVFYGQGLGILSMSGVIEVSKSVYSLTVLGAILVSLLLYTVLHDRVKHTMWIAPMWIMFFNYRGAQKYYTMMLPIAIVVLLVMYKDMGERL